MNGSLIHIGRESFDGYSRVINIKDSVFTNNTYANGGYSLIFIKNCELVIDSCNFTGVGDFDFLDAKISGIDYRNTIENYFLATADQNY